MASQVQSDAIFPSPLFRTAPTVFVIIVADVIIAVVAVTTMFILSARQAAMVDTQEHARQVELELAAMRQRRDEAREDAAAERRRREDAQAAVSCIV